MHERELWWLAGLFEGEGWFGLSRKTVRSKEYINPGMSVKMVDADIIYYVKRLIGHGSIGSTLLPSKKTAYCWSTSGVKAVQAMNELYPILGTRRQGQINLVNEFWNKKKNGLLTHLNLEELLCAE